MDFTELGIVIEVKELHFSKAIKPMDSSDAGNSMEDRFEHSMKA